MDFRRQVDNAISLMIVLSSSLGLFVCGLLTHLNKPLEDRSVLVTSFLLGGLFLIVVTAVRTAIRLDTLIEGLCEQSRQAGWDDRDKQLQSPAATKDETDEFIPEV